MTLGDRMADLIRATIGDDEVMGGGKVHVYRPSCICDEDEDGDLIPNPECGVHFLRPTITYERPPDRG